MNEDNKEIRRDNFKNKTLKHKNKKNIDNIDIRDNNKLQKAFKHKKLEIEQEELWEEWEDEIS